MKKLTMIIVAILITIILSACGEEHNEGDSDGKNLTFITKEESSHMQPIFSFKDGLVYKYKLFFESVDDKEYYYVDVSGWEYDNFEAKKGETLKFKYENGKITHEDSKVFKEPKELHVAEKSLIDDNE